MKIAQLVSFCCFVVALGTTSVMAEDGQKFEAHTSMAEILDNPEARAVMAKYVPDLMGNPQIDQARVISLSELATYVPDQLTDEVINSILADLNKLGN